MNGFETYWANLSDSTKKHLLAMNRVDAFEIIYAAFEKEMIEQERTIREDERRRAAEIAESVSTRQPATFNGLPLYKGASRMKEDIVNAIMAGGEEA
jgi:hypothetical protein